MRAKSDRLYTEYTAYICGLKRKPDFTAANEANIVEFRTGDATAQNKSDPAIGAKPDAGCEIREVSVLVDIIS